MFKHLTAKTPALLILPVVLLLAACGAKNIHEPTPLAELESPAVEPDIVWARKAGWGADKRLGLQPFVVDDYFIVADRKGKITAVDAKTGKRNWFFRSKTQLLAGPTYVDGLLLVTTRDGQLIALEEKTGEQQWHAELNSEAVSAPVVSDGIIYLRTVDSKLSAYELDSGNRIWSHEYSQPRLTTRGQSRPLVIGNRLFVGLDNGDAVALDKANGQTYWQQTIAAPQGRSDLDNLVDLDAEIASAGNNLFVASMGGRLASLTQSSGRIRWTKSVTTAHALALDEKHIYVTDVAGKLHAYKRLSGSQVWSQDAFAYRKLTSPLAFKGYVIFGDYEGYVHFLDATTGKEKGRIRAFEKPIRIMPFVAENLIIVQDIEGRLAAIDILATSADSK